jgi:hypothetical protein
VEVQVLSSALLAALLLGLIVIPRGGSAEAPVQLRGLPLGKTDLRLVAAGNPPFVLDVDTGRVRRVDGIPSIERGHVEVLSVAGRAAVVLLHSGPDARLYAVRGNRVSRLGIGRNATPSADGRSVWVQNRTGPSRCEVRQVALDGRQLRAPRPLPCATRSDPPGGPMGVVAGRTRVVDPLTGRTVVRTRWGILAVAERHLVLAGPGQRLAVLDAETGTERRLPWPSILPWLDRPAVDPRGRFVALGFATPSWRGSGAQVSDVWLLDTESRTLTQLPGMPAFVRLKFTGMAWAGDGRLVLLGETQTTAFVAVWRPGQRRLALKTVHPPKHTGEFAPLR